MKGSAPLSLSSNDLTKVGKGALIAGAGAVLAYLLDYATSLDLVDPENWWAPVIIAGLGVVANLLRKLATDTR
jgi:hypothetical protein